VRTRQNVLGVDGLKLKLVLLTKISTHTHAFRQSSWSHLKAYAVFTASQIPNFRGSGKNC